MPLITRDIWQKSSFALLEKFPLLYTGKERNVSRYAHNRNPHIYQKSISSQLKKPFTINRVTMNSFENMPRIDDAI